MERKRKIRRPAKVRSITASLSVGEDDFTNLPDGCKHVVRAAVVSDSGELLTKMDSPVSFYVTMLSYLETRKGIHELFGEKSDMHFAIKLTHSSVAADRESYERVGKEVPDSIARSDSALSSIIRKSSNGDDRHLNGFHDRAMERYEVLSQTITKGEFDSINSDDLEDFDFNASFSDSMAEA